MGMTLVPPGLTALFDVVSSCEIKEQRTAEDRFDQSRPYITRIYRRRFRMTTLTPQVGPLAVREQFKAWSGISIGSYYQLGTGIEAWSEYDKYSFCTNIVAQPYSDDGCGWMVDVTYEPVDPQAIAEWQNPLTAPIEISYDGQHFEKIVDRGAHVVSGSGVSGTYVADQPIINSAEDPFDPPVKRDDTHTILTIRFNAPVWDGSSGFRDDLMESYNNRINDATWQGRAKHICKIESISAQRAFHPSLYDPAAGNPGYYWQLQVVVHMNPDTWNPKILDAGYRTVDTGTTPHTKHQIIIDGVPATAPVPLNGSGAQATALTSGKLTGSYMQYQIYDELGFAAALGF